MNFNYCIFVTPKSNTKKNFIHHKINGRSCKIESLIVGCPACFSYLTSENEIYRIKTSYVKDISYKEDGNIFVETTNSFYKFKKIGEN